METDLNNLRDRAYKNACNHGFHNEEKIDAHWLMLVITEIAEAVQAHRNKKYADGNDDLPFQPMNKYIFNNGFWIVFKLPKLYYFSFGFDKKSKWFSAHTDVRTKYFRIVVFKFAFWLYR